MDMDAQELQMQIKSLSSLPLLARLRLYSDLVTWANAHTSERRHAIFQDLRQWRVSIFPLLDGGNVSDLEGVSENVCCFLAECTLAYCPLDARVVGVISPGELDLSLSTGMLHAQSSTIGSVYPYKVEGEVYHSVREQTCSVFDTARWAAATAILRGDGNLLNSQPCTIGTARPWYGSTASVVTAMRQWISSRLQKWDGPRLREKLVGAFTKRDQGHHEASERRLFTPASLGRRGSRTDKCAMDAREDFIHNADLGLLLSASELGPAGHALRTLVEMKIINDELEVAIGLSFMASNVALKSNRCDRGSDGVWASECIVQEKLTGFVARRRSSAGSTGEMATMRYIWPTAIRGPFKTEPFVVAFSFWYATDPSMVADPLGIASIWLGHTSI